MTEVKDAPPPGLREIFLTTPDITSSQWQQLSLVTRWLLMVRAPVIIMTITSTVTGILLAALPVPASALPQAGDIPLADDLTMAFASFNDALAAVQGLNLQSGLIDHLDGSYALALIPRPNSPTPVLNTPYDLLAVMQTDDAETARASRVLPGDGSWRAWR